MKNNGKGLVRKAGSVTGNTIVMSAGVLVMAAGASWTAQAAGNIINTFKKSK